MNTIVEKLIKKYKIETIKTPGGTDYEMFMDLRFLNICVYFIRRDCGDIVLLEGMNKDVSFMCSNTKELISIISEVKENYTHNKDEDLEYLHRILELYNQSIDIKYGLK